MNDSVEVLKALKEEISVQMFKTYDAQDSAAFKMMGVITNAIDAVIEKYSGE